MSTLGSARASAAATFGAAWRHPAWGLVLRAVLGYVVLVEIVVQLLIGRIDIPGADIGWLEVGTRSAAIPRGVFLQGAVVGSLYALVGMGLILVYRANRIVNFAQAQLGAVPGVLALLLIARMGMAYFGVLPIVLIGGALLGALVEMVFIRRFATASRLVLTVVTIGVGFLLLVLEYFTKIWVEGELKVIAEFPTPFQDAQFSMGIVRFSGDHIVTVAVVAVLVALVGAILRYTDIGIAIRASAENGDRAALLGIPVRRVSTVVWAMAGVLSAVGVFLRGPLIGLPLSGFVGPTILLFGLAAAVMARMEKLPLALLAGMFIGIIENASLFSLRRAAFGSAAMLVVILGALLVQRNQLSRAHDSGTSSWQMVRDFRPVPLQLRALRELRLARFGVIAVVAAILLAAPWIVGSSGPGLATQAVVYAMVGVSLVVLTGWAGQISLGQFALSGVGAGVAGGLAANHGWDFFLTLLVAGLAGALVAILVGLPAVRLPGLFLAVTTLAFAASVENFVLSKEFFGWMLPAELAFVERPSLYGRLDLGAPSELFGVALDADTKLYYVALFFLLLVLAAVSALRRNRSGRVLVGVRDNPRLMQAFGVNPVRTRLTAFAVSGFIAALAGALLVYEQGSVDPATYTPERSIQLFIMTVIGGIGSLTGAMLGAVFVLGVPLLPGLRDVELIAFLTSGLGVVLVLYFLPGGLVEGWQRMRDTFLRRLAAKHGIHVPSLVADSRVDAGPGDGPGGSPPPVTDETIELVAAANAGPLAAATTDDGGPR